MAYSSVEELIKKAEEKNIELWEVVLEEDMAERDVPKEDSMEKMEEIWNAMLLSSENYDPNLYSNSGLVGTDGAKMEKYLKEKETLSGTFMCKVIAQAIEVGESNACMKRIVAAPTAGSCGVMPAILIPLFKEGKIDKETVLKGLYVSSGLGKVIATRASIAGASGGCQAEVGSASAMAAGALVAMMGGTARQTAEACAIALKNVLGLACDPVAGLVEVPCVKRNVMGAVNAFAAADMVLAGIKSAIPVDQVIDAMGAIGDSMSSSIKETAEGGLAVTPRGLEIAECVKNGVKINR